MSVPFADAAQDIYSQRYNEAQSSPSEARLQRRSQSRAESAEAEQSEDDVARHIKPDPVPESDEEEIVPQTMDVDEDNEEDLPANNHGAQRNAAEDGADNDVENHLGSDDLGVADPMEVDHESSDNASEAPTPASKGNSSGSAKRQAQYGSRPSTGRKRHAKRPFNEAEHSEENNRQAFDELPAASPTATGAKHRRGRNGAAAEDDNNATAGPSSAAKGKGNTNNNLHRAPFLRTPRKVQDPGKGEETTGPFSDFELRNIDRALRQWQEDHDLTDHDRNELIHKNPQHAAAKAAYCGEMWDAIQAVVPQRKRQKIISQCRRKYHNFDARGAWTTEQHEELVQLYNEHGPKYRKIADLINRFAEDVRDRIRNYVVCGDALKSSAWDAAEESKLLEIIHASLEQIRAARGDPNSETNRDAKEEDLIDWQGVSEGMNRERSRLQCMNKWKKLKAAMNGEKDADVNPDESMEEIINNAREEAMQISGHDLSRIAKRIKDTGAASYGRIPWSKVHAEGVGAKYSRPTLIVAWCRLRMLVPEWEHATPVDIASTLRAKYREEGDLELPTDINLEEEYQELEHKIGLMLNKNKATKNSPKKKSANHQERRKSAYLAIKSDDNEDQDEDEEDAPEEASDADMGVGPSSAKIPADREIEESELDEAPPTSTKAKEKGKGKAKPTRRRTAKGPKGKGKVRSQSIAVDEQSSDTDAEDAEDIPARIS
ncbi:hypothetical protein PG993_000846 [Apiospora rasikravindrae]|uniref:Myb-like domain-containing protein n=1 Tax=Apiospora rasikravindrae TaxID=990691 RepID=A0ABR1U9R2_9PEZI